jgi:hypothetical protein
MRAVNPAVFAFLVVLLAASLNNGLSLPANNGLL